MEPSTSPQPPTEEHPQSTSCVSEPTKSTNTAKISPLARARELKDYLLLDMGASFLLGFAEDIVDNAISIVDRLEVPSDTASPPASNITSETLSHFNRASNCMSYLVSDTDKLVQVTGKAVSVAEKLLKLKHRTNTLAEEKWRYVHGVRDKLNQVVGDTAGTISGAFSNSGRRIQEFTLSMGNTLVALSVVDRVQMVSAFVTSKYILILRKTREYANYSRRWITHRTEKVLTFTVEHLPRLVGSVQKEDPSKDSFARQVFEEVYRSVSQKIDHLAALIHVIKLLIRFNSYPEKFSSIQTDSQKYPTPLAYSAVPSPVDTKPPLAMEAATH